MLVTDQAAAVDVRVWFEHRRAISELIRLQKPLRHIHGEQLRRLGLKLFIMSGLLAGDIDARKLPPQSFTDFTSSDEGSSGADAAQAHHTSLSPQKHCKAAKDALHSDARVHPDTQRAGASAVPAEALRQPLTAAAVEAETDTPPAADERRTHALHSADDQQQQELAGLDGPDSATETVPTTVLQTQTTQLASQASSAYRLRKRKAGVRHAACR